MINLHAIHFRRTLPQDLEVALSRRNRGLYSTQRRDWHVLPRHKAGKSVGPGRRNTSTRRSANGVVNLSPLTFLDRVADLVPPLRKHRHGYHGMFAPNHPLRPTVTALAKREHREAERSGDIQLIASITEPGTIRKILTHLGEPLEPLPVSPARGPPTDWRELVQMHDDVEIVQIAPDELPAIDINSL